MAALKIITPVSLTNSLAFIGMGHYRSTLYIYIWLVCLSLTVYEFYKYIWRMFQKHFLFKIRRLEKPSLANFSSWFFSQVILCGVIEWTKPQYYNYHLESQAIDQLDANAEADYYRPMDATQPQRVDEERDLGVTLNCLTRTAYLYNGCLLWYNMVITSQVHSSESTVHSHSCDGRISMLNPCLSWSNFVNTHVTYPTPVSGLT